MIRQSVPTTTYKQEKQKLSFPLYFATLPYSSLLLHDNNNQLLNYSCSSNNQPLSLERERGTTSASMNFGSSHNSTILQEMWNVQELDE
jgi:hypothetical protein